MGLTTKRFFRHWSLRYLHDRLARAFYQHNFSDAPWLTRQANKVLSDWLKPEDSGIEWGAGHSTIWLSQRVKRLISIEHNKEWYEQIKQSLTNKGIENVELYFAPLAPYSQSPDNQEYLEIAERHSEQSMDFVFVDGRLRDHCTRLCRKTHKMPQF